MAVLQNLKRVHESESLTDIEVQENWVISTFVL
ncbi:MAG: hypothetical protein JWQ42_3112 [Edaphobacter sp.]|nr:hypothetical protein [Edaphobacter sp.]